MAKKLALLTLYIFVVAKTFETLRIISHVGDFGYNVGGVSIFICGVMTPWIIKGFKESAKS